jgi:hypothetical protein
MASVLSDLIALTRSLAGDVSHEGNSKSWVDDEITKALNWAQDRYCEATHCSYTQATISTSSVNGTILLPLTSMSVVRVIDDNVADVADATITCASSVAAGGTITATVEEQAGATIFWTVAGGTITSGQGTDEVTITAMNVVGGVVNVGVFVQLNDSTASSSVEVSLT